MQTFLEVYKDEVKFSSLQEKKKAPMNCVSSVKQWVQIRDQYLLTRMEDLPSNPNTVFFVDLLRIKSKTQPSVDFQTIVIALENVVSLKQFKNITHD